VETGKRVEFQQCAQLFLDLQLLPVANIKTGRRQRERQRKQG
jgi:hypothetical protein